MTHTETSRNWTFMANHVIGLSPPSRYDNLSIATPQGILGMRYSFIPSRDLVSTLQFRPPDFPQVLSLAMWLG